MARELLSDEDCNKIRERAEPTGVTCLREDRTVTEFLIDEFSDVLEELRPYTRSLDSEELEEGGVTLWYNPDEGEWYATEVYTQGANYLTRVHRPPEMKYEIGVHTHDALSLGVSPGDVAQLVPYTDDSQRAVGPMEGMAVLSKDIGGFQLYGYERTEAGRAVNDIEAVQEKVAEVDAVLEDGAEDEAHEEFVRDSILRVYGDAAAECHTVWVPEDAEVEIEFEANS